jgi:hypothetical protein
MDINKTDRVTLKRYFTKNAVPTEGNFVELIDSLVNQKDDGIVKVKDEPLSLQAEGGDRKAINFYRSFADPKAAWTLSLNPRLDPANPASITEQGWSLCDADGNSKLFVDQTTGNVGLGTVQPSQRLHVAGGNAVVNNAFVGDVGHGSTWAGLCHSSSVSTTSYGFLHSQNGQYALINKKSGEGFIGLRIDNVDKMVLDNSGNVGIGTTAPSHKFHVVAADAVGLFESSGAEAYLRLYTREGHDYRVEVANRPGGRLSLWTAGGGDVVNITKEGNVGIGTATPVNKLQVAGNLHMDGNSIFFRGKSPADQRDLIRWNEGTDRLDIAGFNGVALGHAQDGQNKVTPGLIIDKEKVKVMDALVIGEKFRINARKDFWGDDHWLRLSNAANTGYASFAADELYAARGGLQQSDLRAKREVTSLQHVQEKILKLRGVQFKWLDAADGDPFAMGLIAQEVEEVFPEVVGTGPNGMKAVNYSVLIAPLIEAVKAQQAEIRELRAQVQALKAHG